MCISTSRKWKDDQNTEDFKMNNLNTKPIKYGDTYKYLSIDENVSYVRNAIKEE